jgi:hypothetical protein
MAVGIVMMFEGVDQSKYDGVMKAMELPLHSNGGGAWPAGIISHSAGKTANGWCVVDVWESEAHFGKFLEGRLKPSFAKVGGMPEPKVTTFELHNRWPQ